MLTTPTKDEAQIRERLDKWIRALRAKDLDALMALYAPDVVTFDLVPPSQVQGAERYRTNFEQWFAALPGPIDYQIQQLHVVADEDVAFCHSLGRVSGTNANGAKVEYWVRVTVGLQRRNGEWMMIHDHVSMPIDRDSMKAVTELQQ